MPTPPDGGRGAALPVSLPEELVVLERSNPRPPSRLARGAILIPLALALAAPVSAPIASAANGVPPGAAAHTTSYRNPVLPRIPGDGVVESCADPSVIKGRGGDPYWYMYCTTDPRNEEDRDAEGNLVLHRLPTSRSLDLVHWDYVGDALPTLPSWADPGSFLWAPDIVYSRTHRQYYLFFGVTDVADSVSGVPDCHGDNAIGVATSESPTGPWRVSDEPVVGPRSAGEGCNFFWTFDPEVMHSAIDTSGYFFYGSYYGGIFGTTIELTETGATVDAAATKQVTIANRYEGPHVVKRGGYYYLFVSATNCCAGPRTGYSVFAGRSKHPLGPYVDKQGNSLLAGRVGGTPVISMNGNRWVGPGHNTVFRDYDGQWWTMYHALNRFNSYFAGQTGITKRPAMLDPLDWVGGWPTVRARRWASDTRMPAPAAQPGQETRYRKRLPHRIVPGARIEANEFNGSLGSGWSWVRKPENAATYGVE
ncbi:MAG: family 43 glycosylhydrolase, partial [Actinomycetota bacterium]|nr:family 43 glycosylhydrolase [Actinomycetota bacterium]